MYSNNVCWHSSLQVKHFVTVATYSIKTHFVKPVLKGNQQDPLKSPRIIKYSFHSSFVN